MARWIHPCNRITRRYDASYDRVSFDQTRNNLVSTALPHSIFPNLLMNIINGVFLSSKMYTVHDWAQVYGSGGLNKTRGVSGGSGTAAWQTGLEGQTVAEPHLILVQEYNIYVMFQ